MGTFLTPTEAKAFAETDAENLIPAGTYQVKILSIEPKMDNPDVKCFAFKITSGPYTRRELRAWPNTAPDLIWTLKKLIGEVVVDANELQLEDLEGHVFEAEVRVETRKDNGEKVNRVVRLLPCALDGFADAEDGEGLVSDDGGAPF
jgi:hypothetical protein